MLRDTLAALLAPLPALAHPGGDHVHGLLAGVEWVVVACGRSGHGGFQQAGQGQAARPTAVFWNGTKPGKASTRASQARTFG